MSSLAATQADGYYIPPEYFDGNQYKKKTLNQFNNSKGHNQFVTDAVVRFEMPYDGFCSGCGHLVGRGTTFNAHKGHVGNYLQSTKIYEFVMKCRACAKAIFAIRTNPSQQTFDYVKGIQKRTIHSAAQQQQQQQQQQPQHNTSTASNDDDDDLIVEITKTLMAATNDNNSKTKKTIDQLEKQAHGQRRAMTELQQLEHLQNLQMAHWKDDAANNATLRAKYRLQRNAQRKRQEEARRLGLGRDIELPDDDTLLLEEEQSSVAAMSSSLLSSAAKVAAKRAKVKEQNRFFKVRTESIFCNSTSSTTTITSKGAIASNTKKSNLKRAPDYSNSNNTTTTKRTANITSVTDPRTSCTSDRHKKIDNTIEKHQQSSLSALAEYSSAEDSDAD